MAEASEAGLGSKGAVVPMMMMTTNLDFRLAGMQNLLNIKTRRVMQRQVHPSVSRLQMCADINQIQYTELRPGSRLTAKWNSGECYAAYPHAIQSDRSGDSGCQIKSYTCIDHTYR